MFCEHVNLYFFFSSTYPAKKLRFLIAKSAKIFARSSDDPWRVVPSRHTPQSALCSCAVVREVNSLVRCRPRWPRSVRFFLVFFSSGENPRAPHRQQHEQECTVRGIPSVLNLKNDYDQAQGDRPGDDRPAAKAEGTTRLRAHLSHALPAAWADQSRSTVGTGPACGCRSRDQGGL